MGAAAQFDRVGLVRHAAHAQHAHFIAILFTEQRHRARFDCIVRAHQPGHDRIVGADFRVHFGLDRGNVLSGQRRRVRKVEPQAVRRDQRALLRHVRTQPAPQRGVQQVRGRVVGADRVAAGDVDIQLHHVANLDRTGLHGAIVGVQPAERLRRVADRDGQAVRAGNGPGITGLAAAFAIERGLVGDDRHRIARSGRLHFGPVLHQRDDLRLARGGSVAGELGRADAFGDVEPHFAVRGLSAALPRGAGGGLLLGHGGVETGLVHADAARAQRVLGQVIGETVSVIEPERGFARQVVALAQFAGRFVQQLEAIGQRAAELHFLALQRFLDQRLGAAQFGIGSAHFRDQRGNQPVHQRLLRAQQVRVAHRPAHDPAQHIAAPFVRRQHAVRQQEAGGAQVVRDHAVAGAALALGAHAGQAFGGGDQRLERVGIIVVMLTLEHGSDAFQAHAGIDAGLGQVAGDFPGGLLELHEHQVPDLDEAVAVFLRRSRRAAPDVVAVIEEDFAARTARAIIAHRPEVVLGGDADDPVFREAGDLLPQLCRFIVGVIDGGEQLVLGQAPFAGQQGPGVGDRLFLEVIAKAEVPQHFEERVVPRGIADVVQVVVLAPGPHALLRGGRARRGAGFQAGEHVLERHHPGVGEHQRRVVIGNQRRGLHHFVPVRAKVFEEGAADFVRRSHSAPPLRQPRRTGKREGAISVIGGSG